MSASLKYATAGVGSLSNVGRIAGAHPPRTEHRAAARPTSLPSEPMQFLGDAISSRGIDPTDERSRTDARFSVLNIETEPGDPKPCPCVLHNGEHKAVVFYDKARRFWLYRCEELPKAIGLADLRARIAGRGERLSAIERVRWRERLDYDAGLLEPIPLDVRLPEPCTSAAGLIVAKYMALFVGLRQGRGEDFLPDQPFTFAKPFGVAYCDELTAEHVREGKDYLERNGVINRVDEEARIDPRTGRSDSRKAVLWKLAAQDNPIPAAYVSGTRREDR